MIKQILRAMCCSNAKVVQQISKASFLSCLFLRATNISLFQLSKGKKTNWSVNAFFWQKHTGRNAWTIAENCRSLIFCRQNLRETAICFCKAVWILDFRRLELAGVFEGQKRHTKFIVTTRFIFIFSMHIPWVKRFQTTSMLITLWSWPLPCDQASSV